MSSRVGLNFVILPFSLNFSSNFLSAKDKDVAEADDDLQIFNLHLWMKILNLWLKNVFKWIISSLFLFFKWAKPGLFSFIFVLFPTQWHTAIAQNFDCINGISEDGVLGIWTRDRRMLAQTDPPRHGRWVIFAHLFLVIDCRRQSKLSFSKWSIQSSNMKL